MRLPQWLRSTRRAAERLLIVTRYPEPGTTKTRLIPTLGADGAAKLHTDMVRHTLAWADELARLLDVQVEIHFTGGNEARMRALFGENRGYRPQADGDLGARLAHACESAFRDGAIRVVIVGTDCPDLSAAHTAAAFRALADSEVVLGPAIDGGYYLIGLSRPQPGLFTAIDWGTERVLAQTLAAAQVRQLAVAQLAPLADVDETRDLAVWERAHVERLQNAEMRTLSIIIPALNEATNLAATLDAIQAEQSDDRSVEVILVDGGSTDDTVAIALRYGARVVSAPCGRARQMNAGADAARGAILLFLHADTLLPSNFVAAIRAAVAEPSVVVGAFRLQIDGPGVVLRVVESMANLRARWRGMPYGDQALFFPAWVFRTVGGFPEHEIMEDFALVDALRHRGRVAIVPNRVRTSARRWRQLGVLRTTLVNQALVAGYRLGVSPQRLAAWYRAGTKQ